MADPTGIFPVNDPTAEPEPGIIEPANNNHNPSADGGEFPSEIIQPVTQPRFQIRAAINSIYNTPRNTGQTDPLANSMPEKPTVPENSFPVVDQAELERAAQVESLIARGQLLARQHQLDNARRTFSEAVRLDPTHSEAWTWLGGLLIDTNLERAHHCLQRAVTLDPGNARAQRGLTQVENRLAQLNPPAEEVAEVNPAPETSQALALIEPETITAAPDEEPGLPDEGAAGNDLAEVEIVPARPNNIKIGVEEAVETLRQSGIETDPENIPLRGALIRPAIEKGELKRLKVRRRRKQLSGFALSMIVLSFFVLILLAGLTAALAPAILAPDAASLTAAANPTETPVPTVPLTADEVFASGIRNEIEHYTRYFATARALRLQVQRGKIVWEDYSNNIRNLQKDIRNEKKSLDDLARNATGKLTPYYRQLQSVATLANQAIDFTASGVENTVPEDLEEGNRQFINASNQLIDLSRNLDQASPVPTTAPTATPRPTATPNRVDTLTPGATNADPPVTPAPPELTATPPVVSQPTVPDTTVPAPTTLAPETTVAPTTAASLTSDTTTVPATATP